MGERGSTKHSLALESINHDRDDDNVPTKSLPDRFTNFCHNVWEGNGYNCKEHCICENFRNIRDGISTPLIEGFAEEHVRLTQEDGRVAYDKYCKAQERKMCRSRMNFGGTPKFYDPYTGKNPQCPHYERSSVRIVPRQDYCSICTWTEDRQCVQRKKRPGKGRLTYCAQYASKGKVLTGRFPPKSRFDSTPCPFSLKDAVWD